MVNPYEYSLRYLWIMKRLLVSEEIPLSPEEKEKLLKSLKEENTLREKAKDFRERILKAKEKETEVEITSDEMTDPFFERSIELVKIVTNGPKKKTPEEILLDEIYRSILKKGDFQFPYYLVLYDYKWNKFVASATVWFLRPRILEDELREYREYGSPTRHEDISISFDPETDMIPDQDDILDEFRRSYKRLYSEMEGEEPYIGSGSYKITEDKMWAYRGNSWGRTIYHEPEDVLAMRKVIDPLTVSTKEKNSIGGILKSLLKKIYKGGNKL